MNAVLLPLTLVVTGAVILVLVGYLLAIIVALYQGQKSLARLAEHLVEVRDNTSGLAESTDAINEALTDLAGPLGSVNTDLERILAVAGQLRGSADDEQSAS